MDRLGGSVMYQEVRGQAPTAPISHQANGATMEYYSPSASWLTSWAESVRP
jgi:hypothetical protein